MSSLERFYILQLWHIIVKEYWFCHTIILYQRANANERVLCCTIIIYVKTCCSIFWKVLKQSMHIKINTKKFSWDKYRKKFIFIFNSETLERAFKNKIGFVSRNKVWWICIKENKQPDEKWHPFARFWPPLGTYKMTSRPYFQIFWKTGNTYLHMLSADGALLHFK